MPQVLTVLATALTLLPVLAADARAQLLLAVDGVELHGTVRRIMPGAGTCNVLETDTSYEAKKANHGAPMDVWRLDFSVRNGSGRWLDHLIARYEVESKWPDCTNWSGPDDARFRELNSDVPLHELTVGWSGTIGSIQESGRNVVQPGQTLTTTEFIIVLSGDPEPRFSNWSTDFDFAAAPPPPGTGASSAAPAATAEQENIFWQSIADSENPAMFEAYMDQFPNGVFRALAEARLAELRTPAPDVTAGAVSPRPDIVGLPAFGSTIAGGADAPRRPGDVFRDCVECPEMVVMPGGRLALGRYMVTVGEYRAFASATGGGAGGGCEAIGVGDSWRTPGLPQTDRHPVVCMSWDDAQEYLSWLSRRAGTVYRLPTEAEWLRAAAGSEGGCFERLTGSRGTCPVGSHGSNTLGLSDMLGNAWEWMDDCWEGDCGQHVLWGGSWDFYAVNLLSPAGQGRNFTSARFHENGFRVARTIGAP